MKLFILALATTLICAQQVRGQQSQTQTINDEMTKMLGRVPTMFKLIPEQMMSASWEEFKNLQLSTATAVPMKYKELIGVAVSAQIPCRYCSYFHHQAVKELVQGSEGEIREAIATAGLARQWSTVLNGVNQNQQAFARDLERMDRASKKYMATVKDKSAMPIVKSSDDVYREAKKMWGFVPKFIEAFPKDSVAAAWNEYNGLFMSANPAVPERYKALISLAVSSQIPCDYCIMMDKSYAKHAGASEQEINEAIALSAHTRKWSTVLNGNLVDESAFRKETDQIISFVKAQNEKNQVRSSSTAESSEP